jgi:hypothetical protein
VGSIALSDLTRLASTSIGREREREAFFIGQVTAGASSKSAVLHGPNQFSMPCKARMQHKLPKTSEPWIYMSLSMSSSPVPLLLATTLVSVNWTRCLSPDVL